ncbi:Uncharacterised protein [Trueperella bialowiezensis]|uniref:Uncharacterized protein n=1 Tax=Trueperella bialowiezensis TaxID=312285 RepID=A0A448PEA2_9ACTO|nr:Uncharacterised protein [Trueperella bialowiezensis]
MTLFARLIVYENVTFPRLFQLRDDVHCCVVGDERWISRCSISVRQTNMFFVVVSTTNRLHLAR